MGEIEKAIEVMQYLVESSRSVLFKSLVGKDERKQVLQGINVAIQALQEKLERDKGCEYCTGNIDSRPYLVKEDGEYAYIDGKGRLTVNDVCEKQLNLCPMCGRKLVE